MSGLRNLLKAAILRILSDGKPRKARELVPVLRSELQREDIDKHEVNSVLYRDLSGAVQCDATFDWHLAESPSVAVQESSELDGLPSRAEMIRTIYRLRAGLPPCENLEHLTVGENRILAVVRALLKPGPGSAWGIVRGDYGGGKTHILTLFADVARHEGYATCHLSADGYANALNHPQRFLPCLLATLEVPLRPTYGYTDLLYDVMCDAQLTERLSSIAASYLEGWTSVAGETRMCLARIVQLLERNEAYSDEWTANLRFVTSHLTGDSIRHLSAAPTYRRTAYNLLSIARDLLVEVGLKGIAIAIDEVESVYTKLPNARSRHGAMRVLAGLCRFAHCRVILAVTPDAFRDIASDVSLTFADSYALPAEDVPGWVNALKSGAVPILDCRPLTREQRKELLEAVRKAYVGAYGNEFASDGFKQHWDENLLHAADPQVSVRLVVRQAINLMDSIRYAL
jgi:hypothetical protein